MPPSIVMCDLSSDPYTLGGLDLICPQMEWSNLISLYGVSSEDSTLVQGTLSIKCTFGGEEVYNVGGERFPVARNRFLLLNCGQQYTSRAERGRNVESLCLFFHPRFVERELRALIAPEDHLLDLPFENYGQPIRFVEQLYAADSVIYPRLTNLHRRLHNASSVRVSKEWLTEEFHTVLGLLFRSHQDVARRIRTLDVTRPATRFELYRRLELARAFIEDNYTRRVLLSDIAGAAFLSPHYLLRMFRQVYRETPHQYLTRRRIEQAASLLAGSDTSVTDICLDLGFDSPNSFSLLFRRHMGVSPREYRKTYKIRGKSFGGAKTQDPIDS